MMERKDGRACNAPRAHRFIPNFVSTAAGSCLIETGGTRVICTASVEEGVPPFLRGKGCGWLTAEYAMLPASTGRRKQRDGLKKDGRGVEISRLIGRALRQAARDHDGRERVLPVAAADDLHALLVARAGHRAGVDDVYIGLLPEIDRPVARPLKVLAHGLRVVLIDLAPEGVKGHGPFPVHERGVLLQPDYSMSSGSNGTMGFITPLART